MQNNHHNTYAGKTALITGGSSGIGLSLAKILFKKGANIWILARDGEKLEAACEQINQLRQSPKQKIQLIQADVSNLEQVHNRLEPMLEQETPHLLINCAGLTHPGLFDQLDHSIFRQMMEVNFFGTLYVTKVVTPAMIKRGSGHIVNISSLVGIHGVYGYSAYSPSKFAVRGLSDVLRYELLPQGVKVSVAFPADTQTPQLEFENQHKPPVLKALVSSNSSVTSPDEVAARILRDVEKGTYLILPSLDSQLYFLASALLPGHALYRFVDFLMAGARRKAAKDLAGKQHKRNPDQA